MRALKRLVFCPWSGRLEPSTVQPYSSCVLWHMPCTVEKNRDSGSTVGRQLHHCERDDDHVCGSTQFLRVILRHSEWINQHHIFPDPTAARKESAPDFESASPTQSFFLTFFADWRAFIDLHCVAIFRPLRAHCVALACLSLCSLSFLVKYWYSNVLPRLRHCCMHQLHRWTSHCKFTHCPFMSQYHSTSLVSLRHSWYQKHPLWRVLKASSRSLTKHAER